MSENNRSAKRRRLSSKYEHATPSKTTPSKLHSQYSAPKRMRDDSADEAALFDDFDGAHDVGRNQSSAAKKLTNGIPRSIQRTPAGSASSPRKNTAKKMAEVKPVENGVQTSGEPSGSEDDTNEPRRSSRKRKSTAKGAEKSWLPNGGASAHKEDSGSSDLLSSIDVASPGAGYQLLLEAVDVEPPSQRKRGRPRRVSQGEAEQHMQEQTPRKLGRPRKTPQGEAEQHAKDRTPRKLERPSKRFEDELRTASNTPRGTHRQERHSQGHTPSKRPRQVIWDDDEDELGMDMDNIVATPKSQGGRARKPEPTEIHSSSGDVEQDLEDDIMGISPDVVAEAEFPNRAATTTTPIRYSLDEHDNQLGMLVTIALEKLAHRRPVPLTHLDDEYAKVYQLVEATVVAGEGNSMLVVGTRGAGKTTLMNKVLLELSRSQNEHFHVVHLNGFIQTDDKLALREIWRQLGKEMDTEEESGKSYSDTLAMLLALLSHPDEIAGEHQDKVAKSVIFVMDEFDHFASHPRQTLLYNLLDIAQSRKAPIAVLGLTTKIDITESFEKRVKSRFSHRYVHLSLAKSLMAFQDICKSALLIQPEELNFEEKAELLNRGLVSATKKKSKGETATTYLAAWNKSVHVSTCNRKYIASN